ncbi:hypothetical protein IRJ41_022766 [Triplophysa rosa]|uniref:Uncharacterized protein n=1 Tax=Triplophysa rosa TaxID=992332 RepID=A0A9W7WRT4_TRIRA|nr:hypothetical protein IRJ41_022766 [Triplophysa rosa]
MLFIFVCLRPIKTAVRSTRLNIRRGESSGADRRGICPVQAVFFPSLHTTGLGPSLPRSSCSRTGGYLHPELRFDPDPRGRYRSGNRRMLNPNLIMEPMFSM